MSGEAPDYSGLPNLTEGTGLDELDVPGVQFETGRIDTQVDYSVAFFIQYDMNAVAGMAPDERQIIPAIGADGLDRLLPPNGSDEGMDEMSGAILGGSKYRLMLGTGGRQIRSVSVDGVAQEASFVVVDGVVLIEVPLFQWLGSPDGVLVSVRWE
jgi:hypothetical protein